MIEIILSSSLLILLLAGVRKILRGRINPGLQYALWLLAAARLLIPGTLFTAPVSVAGAVQDMRDTQWSVMVVPAGNAPVMQNTPAADPPDDPVLPAVNSFPASTPVPDARRSAGEWLVLVWKIGTGITAGALILSNLIFYLRIRKGRELLKLPAAPWSGKLRVFRVNGLPSPCLFGVIRPAIYLNEAAMNASHPEHVLAHEYAHFRHGDHFWSLLRSVCLAVHWYNPLVWWAAAMSKQDCELACDAAVLKKLSGDDYIDYGQTLLSMISKSRNPAALLQTATTMTAGKRAMKERISLIIHQPKMRKITLLLVALLSCVLVACTFGGKSETPAGPSDSIPVAVSVGQSLSSNSNDYSIITDPDEVKRLWDLYQSFAYEGEYDPTGMGGWFVMVTFSFGEEADDDTDIFFILTKHGVHTMDGRDLRLKNIDEIYDEFLRASTSNPITPDSSAAPAEPDADEQNLLENARSIVAQIQRGTDTREWLPLLNYMDWSLIRQALVDAGLDEGDGSGAAVAVVMNRISLFIQEHGADMSAGECLSILSAVDGLDGAATANYSFLIYQLYALNPSQFATVVLDMLPETQQNAVLDFFRTEWFYRRDNSSSDDLPTREEAIEQLQNWKLVGAAAIYASPAEMTLTLAGSTFQFQVFNVPGIYALTYSSSDPNVASVDENGVVTAVGAGSAVITAHCEGGGGIRDFECTVHCNLDAASLPPAPVLPEDEPETLSASVTSEVGKLTDLPAEMTNGWQRTFFGFVFSIPAMPDQELVYDSMTENGLEQAVLSAMDAYYRPYVQEYGNAEHHDHFSRIILESNIPGSVEYGSQITVKYQVVCESQREWNGVTYPLAPQPGDHLSTTFTVMDQLNMSAGQLAAGANGQLDPAPQYDDSYEKFREVHRDAFAALEQLCRDTLDGFAAAPDTSVPYDPSDENSLYMAVSQYLNGYVRSCFGGEFTRSVDDFDVQVSFSLPVGPDGPNGPFTVGYAVHLSAVQFLPGEQYSISAVLDSREFQTVITPVSAV